MLISIVLTSENLDEAVSRKACCPNGSFAGSRFHHWAVSERHRIFVALSTPVPYGTLTHCGTMALCPQA